MKGEQKSNAPYSLNNLIQNGLRDITAHFVFENKFFAAARHDLFFNQEVFFVIVLQC